MAIGSQSSHNNIREANENYALYLGSHFESWCGPRIPSTEPRSAELMAEVERVFQSVNLVRETVDRHVAALIGKFPIWYLKGTDGERISTKDEQGNPTNTRALQAEILLQRWLDAVMQRADSGATDQGDPLWKSVTDLAVTGNASLRLWQPDRFANDPDPINRIHLHAANPGSVTVDRGDDGFIDEISYTYGDGFRETERMEGETLIITTSQNTDAVGEEIRLDTGGRWTVSIMNSPSMITPQIKQNQAAVNHAATMLLRNQEQAGFLERIFLNAQPPGEWVPDPKAPGGERFVPSGEGLARGAGQDIFLAGVPTGDPNNPSYSSPSVVFRDPVSVATFLESIRGFRGFIYHSMGQGHLLMEGDGSISGVSRIQLRQDFEVILTRQKRIIEAAIANILNVVLRILGYTEFEVVCQLRITTGKLAPEEQTAIITKFDKGLLSKATAIALLGDVEDVDAELALISEERQEAMQRRSPLSDPFQLGGNSVESGNPGSNRTIRSTGEGTGGSGTSAAGQGN